MKFPFPYWNQVTPIVVCRTEMNEDGEDVEEILFDGLAFYDDKSKQVLDAERRLITLSGKVIIKGDIEPGKPIRGVVKVDGVTKSIHKSARPRNPDGSVFSTELDLI